MTPHRKPEARGQGPREGGPRHLALSLSSGACTEPYNNQVGAARHCTCRLLLMS